MATQIDERVVSMKFDNARFEEKSRATLKTLEKLHEQSKFEGAGKGLEDLSKAASKVNLDSLENSASAVQVKFSAMSVVAITALQRITNAAIDSGKRIVKALTIDPVTTGFNEYELKMGSIQTIMASTGESIETVSEYLNELNEYSDRTIYSFSDMTQNIGKFTNAGVKLDKAVAAIKGVSNVAAVSGANANEASRAMYNFAQALSAGYVKLIDWKSIENANMATVEFKDQLLETALALGTVTKGADGMYQTLKGNAFNATRNFNEVLTDQWLTTDVLVQTLEKYADETTEIGKKAYASAQDIKTFTMLLDTLKEAAQSGWAMSYELIIGNFEEAKQLWSDVNKVVSGIIEASANERNEMLREWKELGGRDSAIEAVAASWKALMSIIQPFHRALRDLFPPMTGQRLYEITNTVKEFAQGLKLSEEAAYTLQVALKTLLLPVKIVVNLLKVGIAVTAGLAYQLWKLLDAIVALPSKVGSLEDGLRKLFGDDRYEEAADALLEITQRLKNGFKAVKDEVVNTFKAFGGASSTKAYAYLTRFQKVLAPLGNFLLDNIIGGLTKIANFNPSKAVDYIIEFKDRVVETLNSVVQSVKDFFGAFSGKTETKGLDAISAKLTEAHQAVSDLSFKEIFDGIKDGSVGITDILMAIGDAALKLTKKLTPAKILIFGFGTAITLLMFSLINAVDAAKTAFSNFGKVASNFSGILYEIKSAVQPNKYVRVATAIAILAGALVAISLVDSNKVLGATAATVALMGALVGMVAALASIETKMGGKGFAGKMKQLGIGLMAMAASVLELAIALKLLSTIKFGAAVGAFVAMVGVMGTLVAASTLLAKFAPQLSKNALMMVAFSLSVTMIVSALEKIADADLSGVSRSMSSLIAIVGLMTVLAASAKNVKFGAAAGIALMAINLLLIAKTLKSLGKMDTLSIYKGLLQFIPIFIVMRSIAKVAATAGRDAGNFGMTVLGLSVSLVLLGKAVQKIGELDGSVIVKGTAAVVALLGMFSVVGRALTSGDKEGIKTAKIGAQVLAMSLSIAALGLAIKYIGQLDLATVAKGTAAVVALMGMFALVFKMSSMATGSTKTILAMTFAINSLTVIMMMLTLVPVDEMTRSAASLSLILLALGATLKICNNITLNLATTLKSIAALGIVFGMIAVLMHKIKDIHTEGSSETIAAIGMLILSLAASTRIMKTVNFKDGAVTAAAMGVMLATVVAALAVLSVTNTDGILQNATALSEVLLALSMTAMVLNTMKAQNMPELVGVAAALGVMLAGVTAALVILSTMASPEGLIQKASALSIVLLALSGAAIIVSGFKGDLKTASTGVLVMTELIGVFAILTAAFGALTSIPGFSDFINNGVDVFAKIGLAIGSFIGNIIGGLVGSAVSSVAVAAATNMTNFMEEFQGFLDSVKMVDNSHVQGTVNLAKIILALTGAQLLSGIAAFTGLGTSMDAMGRHLEDFAPHIVNYLNAFSSVSDFQKPILATNAISRLIEALPKSGGFAQSILGSKDVGKFGEQLEQFGVGVVNYYDTIKDTEFNQGKIDASVAAASAVASLTEVLPSSGGWAQTILGSKDLGLFGTQLVSLARGIASYNETIQGGGTKLDTKLIEKSAKATAIVAEMANDLPLTGGGIQSLIGTKDLGSFATNLVGVGEGVADYYRAITKNGTEIEPKKIEKSAEAVMSVVDLMNALPNTGGAWQNVFGGVDLGAFATKLEQFGSAISNFYTNISTADVTAIESITTMVSTLSTTIDENINNMKIKGQELAQALVDGLRSRYDRFKIAGQYLITGFIAGINSKKTDARASMTAFADSMIQAAETKFDMNSPSKEFARIGEFVVRGFAVGVEDTTHVAKDGMVKMGAGILQSIQTFFGIHSPSTLMRDEVGRYIVMGIAEGIKSDMSAEEAAAQKAQNIVNAFKTELDKLSLDLTTFDLENQLWTSLNPNATESQQTKQELQLLDKQLEAQGKRVELANAQYQATLKALGSEAEKTQEAYNDYMQEQITFNNYAQSMIEAQSQTAQNTASSMAAYAQLVTQDQEQLLKMGFTLDQIKSYAREKTGYMMESATDTVAQKFSSIQDVISHYIGDVEVVVQQSAAKSIGSGVQKGVQQVASQGNTNGQTIIDAVAQGVENADGSSVTQALSNKFEGSFTNFIDGLVGGASDNADKLGKSGAQMAYDTIKGFDLASLINSPSKVMYERGVYLVQGLVNGIQANSHFAKDAMANLAGMSANQYTGASGGILNGLNTGLANSELSTTTNVEAFLQSIITAIDNEQPIFYESGKKLSQNLAQGVEDGFTTYFEQVTQMLIAQLTELERQVEEKANSIASFVQRILGMTGSVGVTSGGVTPVFSSGDLTGLTVVGGTKRPSKPGIKKSNPVSTTANLAKSVLDVVSVPTATNAAKLASSVVQNTYSFVQNNNSPKALSRTDIYRDTKNQFSAFKKAVSSK